MWKRINEGLNIIVKKRKGQLCLDEVQGSKTNLVRKKVYINGLDE